MEVVDKDGILIGNSFEVEVRAKNQSIDHKPRTITTLDISVEPVTYTGNIGDDLAEKRFENIRLKYNEGIISSICLISLKNTKFWSENYKTVEFKKKNNRYINLNSNEKISCY